MSKHLKTYSLLCIQKMSLSLDASGSQLQPNRSQSAQHRIFLKLMPPTKKAKSKGQLLPAIDLAKGPASATWESGETWISKEAVFLLFPRPPEHQKDTDTEFVVCGWSCSACRILRLWTAARSKTHWAQGTGQEKSQLAVSSLPSIEIEVLIDTCPRFHTSSSACHSCGSHPTPQPQQPHQSDQPGI